MEKLRSHECAMEGYEKLSHFLITIFSSGDYMGKYQNNSALIKISKKNCDIAFKILPPTTQENKEKKWINNEEYKKGDEKRGCFINNVWMDCEDIKMRKKPGSPLRIKNNKK